MYRCDPAPATECVAPRAVPPFPSTSSAPTAPTPTSTGGATRPLHIREIHPVSRYLTCPPFVAKLGCVSPGLRGLVYSKSKTTWIGTTVDKRSATIDGLVSRSVRARIALRLRSRADSAVIGPRSDTPADRRLLRGVAPFRISSVHRGATFSDRCRGGSASFSSTNGAGLLRARRSGTESFGQRRTKDPETTVGDEVDGQEKSKVERKATSVRFGRKTVSFSI